jgi:uncharacterized protein (TIRG00374 family)
LHIFPGEIETKDRAGSTLDVDKKPNTAKNWLVRITHWSVIALCLVYAFWDLDVELFMSTISGYNVLAVMVASLLTLGGFMALGGRLHALSQGEVTYSQSLSGTIIGQGVNNILPAKLGEAVKALYLAKESKKTRAWIFGLVFWERFFDLNALLIFGLLIAFSINSPFSMGAFVLLVAAVWLMLFVIRRWPGFARGFVGRIPFVSIRHFFLELVDHLITRLKFRVVVKGSMWTAVIFFQYVAQVALVLLWAAQLDLSLTGLLVVFVASGIGMNLAASPGGLGVYEAAIVASASWFGVGREEALASAIVLHVIQYLPSIVLGLLLMSRYNMSIHSGKVKFESV